MTHPLSPPAPHLTDAELKATYFTFTPGDPPRRPGDPLLCLYATAGRSVRVIGEVEDRLVFTLVPSVRDVHALAGHNRRFEVMQSWLGRLTDADRLLLAELIRTADGGLTEEVRREAVAARRDFVLDAGGGAEEHGWDHRFLSVEVECRRVVLSVDRTFAVGDAVDLCGCGEHYRHTYTLRGVRKRSARLTDAAGDVRRPSWDTFLQAYAGRLTDDAGRTRQSARNAADAAYAYRSPKGDTPCP